MLQIVVPALVHILVVQVHQIDPVDGHSRSFQGVQLNCRVGDVDLPDPGGGLDFYYIEGITAAFRDDVGPHPDSFKGKGGFVERRNRVGGQQGLGCRDGPVVLQMGFLD